MDETYDETCPHCGRKITDLWDNNWVGKIFIEIECPHCGQDIWVKAEVVYTIGKGTIDDAH